ncbi:P-loop nucleoside triphosphate hydrolase superfamily [Micractinium conductrix]|uniref:DNA-directed RNA polymerase III subunit RPC9 n=1 Tax=Micractinium conductrix TaxID=554055 RepID=A0A2P6VNL0_9CHLO|nr:P-loop nucleoside triphosphate hydrolase superfamily [Micractinium conductrix]|eukprot:PSC75678.1 P-loop nucleoside triphosphate hydrolase superfamily [Micractinium conductrix]
MPPLRWCSWIKGAAKAAGIPVYSIKSASISNLVRAVRTVLGIDPSPGALFNDEESPAAADPRARTSNSRTLRAETSIALAAAAGTGGGGGGPTREPDQRDALEEARLAAENIVIPQQQPVELLPREAAVIDLQAQLVAGLGLPFEVVGAPGSLRLRVLPPTWVAARGTTTGPASGARGAAAPGGDAQAAAAVAAAAAGLEGAKQKDYCFQSLHGACAREPATPSTSMKIVEENIGLLSNDEVLAVLKDREADKQPVISRATPSEIQAYTALLQSVGGSFKDREQLAAFIQAVEPYKVTKHEIVQLINHRPPSVVEIFLCVEDCEDRFTEQQIEDLLKLVHVHLS